MTQENILKPTDLMVGDWVFIPELVYSPEGYKGFDRIKQLRCADLDVLSFKELKYGEIEPIPLTPEILEKNRFNKDNGGEECWGNEMGWFTPHEYDDEFKEISWEVEILGEPNSFYGVINYVHELQHALKLCGFEKEIIL